MAVRHARSLILPASSCQSSFYPLTTTFTPPAACATSWYATATGIIDYAASSILEYDYIFYQDLYEHSTCYPPIACLPATATGGTLSLTTTSIGYPTFSPGICPHGFTTALNSYSGDASLAACCSSGFTPRTDWNACWSPVSTTQTVTLAGSAWTYQSMIFSTAHSKTYTTENCTASTVGDVGMGECSPVTLTASTDNLVTSTSTMTYATTITTVVGTDYGAFTDVASITAFYMPLIWVAYQQSDLSVLSGASASLPTLTAQGNRGGLSTAAKAGIGVGTAVGGVLLIAAFLFFGMARLRRSKARRSNDEGVWNKSELGGEPVNPNEVSGVDSKEMPVPDAPIEMHAAENTHEVEAPATIHEIG